MNTNLKKGECRIGVMGPPRRGYFNSFSALKKVKVDIPPHHDCNGDLYYLTECKASSAIPSISVTQSCAKLHTFWQR